MPQDLIGEKFGSTIGGDAECNLIVKILREVAFCSAVVLSFAPNALAEKPKGKMVAVASVTYALDQEGNGQVGILSLIMTKGAEVDNGLRMVNKGEFSLHLEMQEGKELVTSLNPLCLPLTASDPLEFDAGIFPVVISDFNRDGISEFNFGQPGNSWGGHYMLFTFAADGSGKVEAMTVSKEKEDNYLHPQSGAPSTIELRQTKEGFCYLYTQRGGAETKEVDLHYRWNSKTKAFEQFKSVDR